MAELFREWPICRVHWQRVLEPKQALVDEAVQRFLQLERVSVEVFHDDSLLPPEAVRKSDGSAYKVFTPFWRHVQDLLHAEDFRHQLGPEPAAQRRVVQPDPSEIERLHLLDERPWHQKFNSNWRPGETRAKSLLDSFLRQRATSRLSPSLHFGEISVARVYDSCQMLLSHETDEGLNTGIRRFLSEIGWREFARHVLHAHPNAPQQSLNARFEQPGVWEVDPDDERLRAWQHGETGVPLVDAGMHELWETGWMHNRVRMIVASSTGDG